jgi:signal transduction histidine kinase
MDLDLSTFEIGAMVQDVAAIVQPLVEKNGNTLVIACPEDIGTMHADQTKLRQTLFNLLSNAAKFTERGTITLAVSRAPPTPTPLPRTRERGSLQATCKLVPPLHRSGEGGQGVGLSPSPSRTPGSG